MLVVRNPPAKAGDAKDSGLSPRLGRSPEVGNGNLLQYTCLQCLATHSSILARKKVMNRAAWWLQSMGLQTVRHNWAHTHTHTHSWEEGPSCFSLAPSFTIHEGQRCILHLWTFAPAVPSPAMLFPVSSISQLVLSLQPLAYMPLLPRGQPRSFFVNSNDSLSDTPGSFFNCAHHNRNDQIVCFT